jgi:hypothetical protein
MNFNNAISSDFMKLANIPITKRRNLINFANSDFLGLRESLINYAKAVYPQDYDYFVESDFGIMLLELVAYMGSVLSMKADMLANENFLSTAKQRASVKKLLELIGVRMRGPLSSAADAKIDLQKGSAVTSNITISPENRVIEVRSLEDGEILTFTLYKIVNGLIEDLRRSDGKITLLPSEGLGINKDIFTNLAIQEGSLITESGEFTATEGQKVIKLSKSPIIDGSIRVYITSEQPSVNGEYKEVDNIYFASGLSDKIFEVVYTNDYEGSVVFGDGVAGISPEDSASYFVEYRVGGGSRGNIPKDFINYQIDVTEGASDRSAVLTNTSIGSGGSDAETIQHAKQYAPLTFRRQDRLVTLEDYTSFTNTFISSFGTIGKANAATRKAYASANVIDIYVLEKASDIQLKKATPVFKTQLLEAINNKKMATDEVVIVDGLLRTLDLVVSIKVDLEEQSRESEIMAKTRNSILRFFNVDNRSFGESLSIADLNRAIFEVDEVRFSTIDNVQQNINIDFNEIIQLNNLTINIEYLQ